MFSTAAQYLEWKNKLKKVNFYLNRCALLDFLNFISVMSNRMVTFHFTKKNLLYENTPFILYSTTVLPASESKIFLNTRIYHFVVIYQTKTVSQPPCSIFLRSICGRRGLLFLAIKSGAKFLKIHSVSIICEKTSSETKNLM